MNYFHTRGNVLPYPLPYPDEDDSIVVVGGAGAPLMPCSGCGGSRWGSAAQPLA